MKKIALLLLCPVFLLFGSCGLLQPMANTNETANNNAALAALLGQTSTAAAPTTSAGQSLIGSLLGQVTGTKATQSNALSAWTVVNGLASGQSLTDIAVNAAKQKLQEQVSTVVTNAVLNYMGMGQQTQTAASGNNALVNTLVSATTQSLASKAVNSVADDLMKGVNVATQDVAKTDGTTDCYSAAGIGLETLLGNIQNASALTSLLTGQTSAASQPAATTATTTTAPTINAKTLSGALAAAISAYNATK